MFLKCTFYPSLENDLVSITASQDVPHTLCQGGSNLHAVL